MFDSYGFITLPMRNEAEDIPNASSLLFLGSHNAGTDHIQENLEYTLKSIERKAPHQYCILIGKTDDTLNKDIKSVNQKIVILHAINSKTKLKKGNKFFEKSLSIIEAKYSNKVEIIRTIDQAYSDHIKNVKNCEILLDQVYAYDQGYNALEAMAMGKVVLTGAEKEWREYYLSLIHISEPTRPY